MSRYCRTTKPSKKPSTSSGDTNNGKAKSHSSRVLVNHQLNKAQESQASQRCNAMDLADRIGLRKEKFNCEWANPRESIGDRLGDIQSGKYTCWKPVGRAREAWNAVRPRIKEYLDNFCQSNSSSVILEMYMIGKTEETASPTILICSSDRATRKNIRKTIRENKFLERYPGIGLGDTNELPDRRRVIRMAGLHSTRGSVHIVGADTETPDVYTFRDAKCVVGRQLFITTGEHGRIATGGPIVWIQEKSYQLSVAHVLQPVHDIGNGSDGSSALDECSFDGDSEMQEDAGDIPDQEVPGKWSNTPEELHSWSSDDDSYSESSTSPQETDSRISTVPTTSDALSRMSAVSDYEMSLASHRSQPAQHLNAASTRVDDMIKRNDHNLRHIGKITLTSNDSTQIDLDYALVELGESVEEHGSIKFERDGVERCLQISQVAEIGLHDVDVVTQTASKGVLTGKLSATASYMRLPNSKTFQELFLVQLSDVLSAGDCGAGIISQTTGEFYGQVVAGTPGSGLAYVVPATQVIRDITERLELEVKLAPPAATSRQRMRIRHEQQAQWDKSEDEPSDKTRKPVIHALSQPHRVTGSRFTDEEKRFLLAEMIKASELEVEVIGKFVNDHVAKPNWMQMQLPLEQLGFKHQHPGLKRKMPGDQSEPAAKRITLPGNTEPTATLAAVPSTSLDILAHLATNSAEIPSMKAPQASPPTAPKKTGRPARADNARFRPILPKNLAPAPRPFKQSQHSLESQHGDSSQRQSQALATPPQTVILPSSPGPGLTPSLMNSNDGTFYARLATGEGKDFEALRPVALPGPILLNPKPRASRSRLSSPPEE
ncbi:hypothetical protein EDB80DRAFT_729363 [Ilyonectria destructans]|nr:hypothetical protein EDB80DRAFT_729363 [Ilyonectria destructans]